MKDTGFHLKAGKCSVQSLNIHTLTDQDIELTARILPKRYLRSLQFRFPDDRLRCIGAGRLLINELGLEREDQLTIDCNGKPMAAAAGFPFFNISHSGDIVVLATAPYPVGVDIERMEACNLDVAERIFSADELSWMMQDRLARFHLLWTQKESVIKLDGRGMQIDLSSFEISPPGSSTSTILDGRKIDVSGFLYSQYAVSIARFR